MRVHTIAFAMIAALFHAGPCQADFWPDHAPSAFAEYAQATANTSHDPAVTGRAVPIVSVDVRTDALGHVVYAEELVPDGGEEIVLADLPQPTDAGEVIARDILVQVLRAAARARLTTDDAMLNRLIATYLEEAEITTGALPRAEELKPYISHEAEDAAGELTIGFGTPRLAERDNMASDDEVALPFELPSGV